MSSPMDPGSLLGLVREDLRGFGGYASARTTDLRGEVWLNANESPWPNPADATGSSRRYPEPQPPALRQALARLYGCDPAQVLVGRGSDEFVVGEPGRVDPTGRDSWRRSRFQRPQHGCGSMQSQSERVVARDDGVDRRVELLGRLHREVAVTGVLVAVAGQTVTGLGPRLRHGLRL